MSIEKLVRHISALVDSDVEFRSVFTDEWLYLDLPQTFPSLVISGLFCTDDKLGTYQFNLDLYAKSVGGDGDDFTDLQFYTLADQLKDILKTSNAIVGGSWVSRGEPQRNIHRTLFPCAVYMGNL